MTGSGVSAGGDGNGVALCDIGAYERGGNPYLPPGGGKFAESPDSESDPWGRLTTFEPEEPSEPTSLTKR